MLGEESSHRPALAAQYLVPRNRLQHGRVGQSHSFKLDLIASWDPTSSKKLVYVSRQFNLHGTIAPTDGLAITFGTSEDK